MSDNLKIISTEFYDGQGLGNQLWVYASARSIAAKKGANFFYWELISLKVITF